MAKERLGAEPLEGGSCRFCVWAPHAERVEVVLDDGARVEPLARTDVGYHRGVVDGVGAGDRYRYRLDGRDEFPDPASRSQPDGVHGPSEVVDPAAFPWSDEGWFGLPRRDLVLYELHVGTFSDEGTFAGVAAHLDELVELGVTAVEVMPI